MKKNLVIIGLFGMIVLVACSTQSTTITTDTNSGIVSTNPPNTGNTVEVNLEAWQWDFSPKEIRVKEGDTVRITATSRDVTHGFYIPEFGVNINIYPGETVTEEFVAVKKGTYTFSCSVYCGDGHEGQQGVLIVE